jgi:hypothetical protein
VSRELNSHTPSHSHGPLVSLIVKALVQREMCVICLSQSHVEVLGIYAAAAVTDTAMLDDTA